MYNFFINNNQIDNNIAQIKGSDVNHIENVLRMQIGDKIIISDKDKSISYYANIKEINKESVFCELIERKETTESPIKVTIYQGLPKSEKMEYIIQKATELGASKIIPVDMKYCISKIKDEEKKHERWQKIAEVAAKQSKRTIIPEIGKLKNIDKICDEIKEYDIVLVAYENEEKINIKEELKKEKNASKIAIVIGPEGGLDQREVNKLKDNGAKIVTLGNRILRTETASLMMLSMIMYELEF